MKYIKNFFKHLKTVIVHKWYVMIYCFKAGLIWQGIFHDTSKFSITEFWTSVKYFLGNKSPINAERAAKGRSDVWMHHKGRNKHHPEYWIDKNLITEEYECVEMPFKYVVESVCDRIAASRVYNKKNFKPQMVLDYFLKEENTLPVHPNTKIEYTLLLTFYVEYGEKELFKYIRKELKRRKG